MEANDIRSFFKKYPHCGDETCYLRSFPATSDNYSDIKETLDEYGLCIVQLLSPEECKQSIEAMQQEVRSTAPKAKCPVDFSDSRTWDDKNWPSKSRHLLQDVAMHAQAFQNRTREDLYELFSYLFDGERKLWTSIDRWGVLRGTKDIVMPDGSIKRDIAKWRHNLELHVDVNPWTYYPELEEGKAKMYQGVLALVDCDLKQGSFLAVPGSHKYMKVFSDKVTPPKDWRPGTSLRIPKHDITHKFPQKIPLRAGEFVIFDGGLVHANYPNNASELRLVQFIRLMPADDLGKDRDKFSAPRILGSRMDRFPQDIAWDDRQRKMLGLETWEES